VSAGRWFAQWAGLVVVLVLLTVRVGRVEFAVPVVGEVGLDFAGAYGRLTWRLVLFLMLAAALVVWSWRARKEVSR
jgi:hypothetical protein